MLLGLSAKNHYEIRDGKKGEIVNSPFNRLYFR